MKTFATTTKRNTPRARRKAAPSPSSSAQSVEVRQILHGPRPRTKLGAGEQAVPPSVSAQIESLRGGGQPLPESTRAFFEPRLGHDLSQLRIHTDARAAESAKAASARAYTVGRDVVFARGQFAPHTTEGKKLIAHELTHAVQQAQGGSDRGILQRQEAESPAPRKFLVGIPAEGIYLKVEPRTDAHNFPGDKAQKNDDVIVKNTGGAATYRNVRNGTWSWIEVPNRSSRDPQYPVLHGFIPSRNIRGVAVGPVEALGRTEQHAKAVTKAMLAYIKREARSRAKKKKSIATSSSFYKRLENYYLKDYLESPGPQKGKEAISKIGDTFNRTPRYWWEEQALRQWNKQKLPPGLEHIRPGLPKEISAATDILSRENIAHLKYLDIPHLVGKPNLRRSDDADLEVGGKNISQLMHWATGVKYSEHNESDMRDLFLAYEMWKMEGWDVFHDDSINDLIAEEAGRIMGTELRDGKITKANLQARLNEGFAEARAWVGSLLRARRKELDNWILAKEQKNTLFHWKTEREAWRSPTIYEQLKAGYNFEYVKNSDFTQRVIEIYTLIYEADKWERAKGSKIGHSKLVANLLKGEFNDLLKKVSSGEQLRSDDIKDARDKAVD